MAPAPLRRSTRPGPGATPAATACASYLRWAALQGDRERGVAESILPETDDDAVRIMTIHAAKGLEFPITIVVGLTTAPMAAVGPAPSCGTTARGRSPSKHGDEIYDDFKPIDEQMSDAERRRLLYVACTRAIDHLVVSLHRVPPKPDVAANRMPSATLLASAGAADAATGAHELAANPGDFAVPPLAPEELEWSDVAVWEAERTRRPRRRRAPASVSATRLAEDLAVEPMAGDPRGSRRRPPQGRRRPRAPPWQRGRYGTAVGRAVHGTLQFCDLAHGHDIDGLAAGQCAAEGIIGLEASVAALARSALSAPAVRAALTAEHHRELFVAAPVGDRVLEGYVDLLVRTDGGYVIVDYKTDAWRPGTDRAERIARYRRQLAAYALALEHVTGEPIVAGVLVHCRATGDAEQIELDAWPEAVAELPRRDGCRLRPAQRARRVV